jgi:hypothetical protein
MFSRSRSQVGRKGALTVVLVALTAVVASITSVAGGSTSRYAWSKGNLIESLRLPVLHSALAATASGRSGTLTIWVEIPTRFDAHGLPTHFLAVPLRTERLSPAAVAAVPVTGRMVRRATDRHGLATYLFVARVGDREAVSVNTLPTMKQFGVVAASPALRNATLGRPLQFSHWIDLHHAGSRSSVRAPGAPARAGSADSSTPSTTAAEPTTPIPSGPAGSVGSPGVVSPDICQIKEVNSGEGNPKVGEFHTSYAYDNGATAGTFEYETQADSTFTLGISSSETSGFSAGGSYTVDNSFAGDGSYEVPVSRDMYLHDHQYWEELWYPPGCGGVYEVSYYQSAGDVDYNASEEFSAGTDPWGRCGLDPNGKAEIQPGASWGSTRGQAYTFGASDDWAGTLFGFGISGSTGYTKTITIKYAVNRTTQNFFVCGTAPLPDTPVVWENDGNGV